MFSVLNGGASVTAAKIAGPAVNLKILVPAVASGAIIGKGGETIAEIQKQTGTRIKMSKANDFYPGTTERVGLLQGTYKVEKIKGSLDSIPLNSPPVKIQIMGGKVCLSCKGKTLLGVVNKLLNTKNLLTMPSNGCLYASNKLSCP